MSPLLGGLSGELDLTIVEGSRFNPRFLHLVEDAVDETGDPVPFPAGTTAYLTVRQEIGGRVLLELGPTAAALDGEITVDADDGVIQCDMEPLETLALPLPHGVLAGAWDLIIYPADDEEQAYQLLHGRVKYMRRVSERPEAP